MILSDTIAFNAKLDYKIDGQTYNLTQQVTFKKAFDNPPVVNLSLNGLSCSIFNPKTEVFQRPLFQNVLGGIRDFSLNAVNVSSKGFTIQVQFIAWNISSDSFTINLNPFVKINWIAYNEVTIGA